MDAGIVSHGTWSGTSRMAAPRSASAAAVAPIVIAVQGRSFSIATSAAMAIIQEMLITPSANMATADAESPLVNSHHERAGGVWPPSK